MNYVFRCDANTQVGLGHFTRCLTLANALKKIAALDETNINCIFIMAEPSVDINLNIKKSQHQLLTIKTPSDGEFNNNIDANNCIEELKNENITPNWIIIDQYQLTPTWWQNFNKSSTKLMLLNDPGLAIEGIDCIWDPAATNADVYSALSNRPILLLGPEYILLRPEFLSQTRSYQTPEVNEKINILISIGATDPLNTGGKLIYWLLELMPNLNITLMGTSSNPHIKRLKSTFKNSINFEINSQCIAKIMTKQHLIITAAGNMLWEAFSLGVPCAIVKTCENQQRNINLVTNVMEGIYLGEELTLNKQAVVHTLLTLIKHKDKLSLLSDLAHKLCDGAGSLRVAKSLLASQKPSKEGKHD